MYEEDDLAVSALIKKEKERVPRSGNGPLLLVQFYDARNTWYGFLFNFCSSHFVLMLDDQAMASRG